MDDMDRSPPKNPTLRRFLFIGGAIAVVVAGRWFGGRGRHEASRPGSASAPGERAEPETPRGLPSTSPLVRLRRPPAAVAELGVLTARPEAELTTLLDRASLGASLTPALCGDEG